MDGILDTYLSNQRLVDRLFTEVLNGGDLSALPEIYATDVVDRHPLPGGPAGLDGVRHSIAGIRRAFPDGAYEVDGITCTSDTVSVRVIFRGHQTRRLLLQPGNGRYRTITNVVTFRIADNLIVERWVESAKSRSGRHAPAPIPPVRSPRQTGGIGDPMQNRKHRPRALIIGGGIGGLTAAIALERAGHDVAVFERAAQPRHSGAGIHLWSNAILALDAIGLGHQVRDSTFPQDSLEFTDAHGRILARWPVGEFERTLGAPVVAMSRADLTSILRRGLDSNRFHLGAELVSFSQDRDKVHAVFADGREEVGDLLIGADGLHSAVRRQLLGPEKPRYAGYSTWRAIADISHPDIGQGSFRTSFGRGDRFVYYSVGPNRVHWMSVANVPAGGSDGPDLKQMLRDRHAGWQEQITALIDATPAQDIIRTDIHDRKPIKNWGTGRVTLIGDAAHPMTFNTGQGAGMAIEDGIVLAATLGSIAVIPDALRSFERTRQPRTASMVRAAGALGRLNSWSSRAGVLTRETIMRVSWEQFAFRKTARDLGYATRLRESLPMPAGDSLTA